jgi:hypothetical protein
MHVYAINTKQLDIHFYCKYYSHQQINLHAPSMIFIYQEVKHVYYQNTLVVSNSGVCLSAGL